MIAADQPSCFPETVKVRVSSKAEGTVLDKAIGVHHPYVVTNRTRVCDQAGISYGDVVYQRITYSDTRTYDVIKKVNDSHTCSHVDEVIADALITTDRHVGLLLPVADCVATVCYDPRTEQLALVHLGRHSSVAGLMKKVVHAMVQAGAHAPDIIIWMAPSVGAESYRMEYFDEAKSREWRAFVNKKPDGIYLDLKGFNRAQAIESGVAPENIHLSLVDTVTSPNYFSHSQGDTTGRFAVVAYRRS